MKYPQLMLLAVCAAASVPAASHAQEGQREPPAGLRSTLELTLSEARDLALARNPRLRAARRSIAVAESGVRSASVIPSNPVVEWEARDPRRAAGLGQYELRLSQTVEVGGQRGLRIGAAGHDLEAQIWRVMDEERATLARTSRAWYEVVAFDAQLSVARRIADEFDQLAVATRTQLEEGQISVMEANIARIERGRSRAKMLESERNLERAKAALRFETGAGSADSIVAVVGPDAPLPASELLAREELIAMAMAGRPDLQALRESSSSIQTQRRLAARAAVPDLTFSLINERTPGLDAPGIYQPPERSIGFGVEVPIPLLNRQQGTVALQNAESERIQAEIAARQSAIEAEVDLALSAYRSAEDELRLFTDDVLEPAQQNDGLLQGAYDAGKIDLAALVVLRNQLFDALGGYWETWLEHRMALTDLENAIGASLPRDAVAMAGGGAR